MVNENSARSAPPGTTRASATNRGVAIGGNASNNVIVTGDGNQVTQVTLERFGGKLREMRQAVSRAALDAETRESLDEELAGIERQTVKEKPSRPLILGKLQAILGVLKAAGEAGTKLVPAARWLGEAAAGLF